MKSLSATKVKIAFLILPGALVIMPQCSVGHFYNEGRSCYFVWSHI